MILKTWLKDQVLEWAPKKVFGGSTPTELLDRPYILILMNMRSPESCQENELA